MIDEKELPKGWMLKRIGEICEINPKFPLDLLDDSMHVSFVPMKNVEEETGKIDSCEKKTIAAAKKGYTPFRNNDIIFAKITPCMENGKIAIAEKLENGIGFGSTEFIVLRTVDGVYNKFLFYFLIQKSFRHIAASNMTGAVGQRRVPKTFLENVEIPIAPLDQQQLIVTKIEEFFSDLDKGVESLKTAQEQLKVYRQAVLNSAIKGESYKSIESVINSIDQGWSPRCLNESTENENEWCVIKTTAIQSGYFDSSKNKKLPMDLKPRGQHELKMGDLLITRAGPRIRVGVCCLVRKIRSKLLNCDKVYRMRVNPKIVMPEYVELILNSPRFSKEIDRMKTGISDSGVNLTQRGFLKLLIPTPSILEQRRIVEEIEFRLSVCDKIEETIEASLQQSELLRQSILKKAFEGKLT